MKPILIISFSILGLLSCHSKTNDNSKRLPYLAPDEEKGIREILAFYGGKCDYRINKQFSTNGQNETSFLIKLSGSKLVDITPEKANLICANLAYLFFRNLSTAKKNYDYIQCELEITGGPNVGGQFTIPQLEIVNKKFATIYKVAEIIKNKQFDQLKDLLVIDSSFIVYEKPKLIENIRKVESSYSKVVKFVPFGFAFLKYNNGNEILHLSGSLDRESTTGTALSINVDPNSEKEVIFSMNYKY